MLIRLTGSLRIIARSLVFICCQPFCAKSLAGFYIRSDGSRVSMCQRTQKLLLPCGGVSASNQTPHLCGGYLGSAAGFEPATCARKCKVFQPLCFYFASLHRSTFELHTSCCYLSFTFSTFHVLCMVAIRSIYPLYSSICSGL